MKIAVVKDMHNRAGLGKPLGRTDTFDEDIANKDKQVIAECLKRGISHVINTGDLFDIKAPSSYGLTANYKTADRYKAYSDAGITLMSILGNHDLPMSSLDNIDKSAYWFFSNKAGLFKHIGDCTPTIDGYVVSNTPHVIGNVNIWGIDFRPSVDAQLARLAEVQQLIESSYSDYINIVVIHEHCTPAKSTESWTHSITYKKLSKTCPNVDVFLCGHLHKGFEPYENDNGQIFINPWSFTRLARNYYAVNEEHTPQVDVIDFDTGETETIYLRFNS